MYLNPPHLPNACILVLEEDPFLRADLAGLLRDAGYALVPCADGGAAAGRTDLVLAGLGAQRSLPAALRWIDHAVPVILLVDHAAWRGLDFLDAANEIGAVAVLPRPFSRAALLSLVAKTLPQPLRDAPADRDTELPTLADALIYLDSPNFPLAERNSHPDAE